MSPSTMARGVRVEPSKATPVELRPGMSTGEALRAIVRNCAAHFRANEGGVHGRSPIEFVHQARIGLRRLRSALRLVHPDDSGVEHLRHEFRWVAGRLGTARDWDVFIESIEPIAAAHVGREGKAQFALLLAAAREKRKLARSRVRKALRSARLAAMLVNLDGWADEPPAADSIDLALTRFAAGQVSKRHKRLFRHDDSLATRTPQQRHRIRIEAKRLRYVVEFFAPLFAQGQVRKYLRELAALQDALGALNDVETADRLMRRLPRIPAAAPSIRRWKALHRATHLARAEAALLRLRDCRHFWKAPKRRSTAA